MWPVVACTRRCNVAAVEHVSSSYHCCLHSGAVVGVCARTFRTLVLSHMLSFPCLHLPWNIHALDLVLVVMQSSTLAAFGCCSFSHAIELFAALNYALFNISSCYTAIVVILCCLDLCPQPIALLANQRTHKALCCSTCRCAGNPALAVTSNIYYGLNRLINT